MDRYLAYEASAGSGKTFALVIRYISLLYLGAKPNSILTLTFTNKAANEMKERINIVLKELDQPQRENELYEISRECGISIDEILKKRDIIYQSFLKSDLKISTIDKFFAQILRNFSLHLALMPDFQIDENIDEKIFINNFLKKVKNRDRYKELVKFAVKESKKLGSIFNFLNDLYKKDGELKNLTLNRTINSDVEKKILNLTFRLKELFLSCEILSESGKKALSFDTVEDIIEKSWLQKRSLQDYNYFKKCFLDNYDDIFFELKNAINEYFVTKENYLLERYFDLLTIYKESKREQNISQNVLGFDDITNSVFELLNGNINSDFLYFRLDSKIDHILIDEFQDTNIIQYKILKPILDEIRSGIGVKEFKTLFYVGDIKQSIYRFRGGAKELFAHVQREYDVKLKALTTNYRSRANIVRFVNDSFRDLIDGYRDQQFIGDDSAGYIKVSSSEDLLEEIKVNLFNLIDRGINSADISILTYTNDDAFLIEESLLQKDPSLQITTQTTSKLINDPIVLAIIELLKYIYFKESIYRANFLTSIGLSWDDTLDINEFDKNQNLLILVKNIIDKFNLYSENPSIFKFLEVVSNYKDIEEFLFESEELNIDSPAKKEQGIKILTMHKSKGLEFDHVIVCDRFKKKKSGSASLIYKYDDIELKNLYIRMKKREFFDNDYKDAMVSEKKLSYEDGLNLLYVAFTRAKESLHICKNEKDSSFDILNLEDQEIGKLKVTKESKSSIVKQELDYERKVLGLQDKNPKNGQNNKDDFEAIYFGTALHYMLEIIESFTQIDIQRAYWAMRNRYEIYLEPNRCQEIKQRVSRLLEFKPFLELTNGKILKEQPISFNGELKQIDLLIEKEDKWVIIDYKSSKEVRNEHKTQVSNYKNAMSKIVDKDVIAYLCYIREDEIELVSI